MQRSQPWRLRTLNSDPWSPPPSLSESHRDTSELHHLISFARARRHDGRGGAPEDRLHRRGRVGAGDGAVGRCPRAGNGRAGHLRLLRRALPFARPGAPGGALRRRRAPALRAAGRRQAPQHLRARQALPRLPRGAPGPRRVREPRHRRRAQAGRTPLLRRAHVPRRRQRRLLIRRRNDGSETVHGAAARMAELEWVVRRMVMEGLGVSQAQREPMMWHLFRMSEYGALTGDEKQRAVRYGSHQDTNWLSVVCQHEVDGLEMQARDGRWVLVQPSPESLVVMAGNALRAWSNDRVHAPFHRISVGGDATRYSAMLFSVPADPTIRAPDELVDEAGGHPRRFGDYDYDEFVRFCVSLGGRSARGQAQGLPWSVGGAGPVRGRQARSSPLSSPDFTVEIRAM